jgi:4-amino-4-deoxy-L-arabinose transferase-like glycosyltransferase
MVAVLAAVVLVGVALRVWVLTSSLGPFDSDEATGGLVARHFLHGEGSVFLWGNNYGGTLEAILTAPLFAVFGSGLVTLKLVPIGAFAAACLLTWRIGLRTVGPDAARLGAALLWVASGTVVVLSTKARLYYGSSMVITCATVLLCLRLAEKPSRRDLAVLGLVLGLGLWTAPFVFYVALPALLWLFTTRPRLLLELPWAVPGSVLGAAPWLSYNLRTGWSALHEHHDPIPIPTSYGIRLHDFYTRTVPKLLGLRAFSEPWTPGRAGKLIFVGLLAGGVALVAWCVWHRRSRLVPLVVIAVVYPFLFALPRSSWYFGEPRYGLFLAPVLALLVALGVTRALPHAGLQLAFFALVALTSVASIHGLIAYGDRHPGHHDLTPDRLGALADTLRREGVRTVVADYWIAYALSFEARERIIATPTGKVRYRPYQERVAAAGARTYVFFQGQPDGPKLVAAARAAGIGYRTQVVGSFDVFLFDQPVGQPPQPD